MHIWKTLKVFVSSTFKDLELERDQLAQVFQDLKAELFSRQLTLIPYDLRWQERHINQGLVRWCLDMVQRCQYFVGIIGLRYGWRPCEDELGNANTAGYSITGMEIRKALAVIPREKRFFCFGSMEQYSAAQLEEQTPDDLQSIEDLKKMLRDAGEIIYEYNNFQELQNIIRCQLRTVVNQDYPPQQQVPVEVYNNKQGLREIIDYKTRGFVGRKKYLQLLQSFAAGNDAKNYLAVNAVAGSGKSALLAQFIKLWQSQSDVPLIAHYLSLPDEGNTVNGILRNLGEQLQELAIIAELPQEFEKMRMQVRTALELYRHPLVVVIDGLDELAASGSTLTWLPQNLPPSVRVIISTRPVSPWETLQKYSCLQTLSLPALNDIEIQEIIGDYNTKHGLQLGDADKETLKKRSAGNPLFLKVALDEIVSSGIAVGQLATTIEALFTQILERLHQQYGETTIKGYLGFIAASQNGLPESELLELLTSGKQNKLNAAFFNKAQQVAKDFAAPLQKLQEQYGDDLITDYLGFMAATHAGIPEDELKELLTAGDKSKITTDVLWRIHKALENFVIERSGLLTFFHPEFERSIKMWIGKAGMRDYHQKFAAYLQKKGYNYVRTLSELPYQQQWAEEYSQLIATLVDFDFLQAKCNADLTYRLIEDMERALNNPVVPIPQQTRIEIAPQVVVDRNIIWLLARALHLDGQFLRRHPQCLLQCLWNRGYWHDSPASEHHRETIAVLTNGSTQVYRLVENWRQSQKCNKVWLKSRRPLLPNLASPLLETLKGHEGEVLCATFSPDGMYVASSSKDKTIRLWEVVGGEMIRTFSGHEKTVESVCFSPNGEKMASASWDKSIRIWEVMSGECLQVLTGHKDAVTSVAFNHDGTRIISGSEDKTVRIWDVADGQCRRKLLGHKDAVTCVACNQDSSCIASASEDRTILLWDMETGGLQTLTGHENWVRNIAFTPDGKKLASASEDKTVRVWDIKNEKCLLVLKEHEKEVLGVAISPDGKKLVSSSADKTIKTYNLEQGNCEYVLKGHQNSVFSVSFCPDSIHLVSASSDNTARIWDVTGHESPPALQGHEDRITSVAVNEQSRIAASGSYDMNVRIWDLQRGNCLHVLAGHLALVTSISFSSDGCKLASCSFDNTVRLWDTASGRCLHVLQGHMHAVYQAIFTSDNDRLLSCSCDRTLRIWDIASGENVHTLVGHQRDVTIACFTNDDRLIASGSKDHTVRIWDSQSGRCLHTLTGHKRAVTDIDFDISGNRLVSASEDNTIRVWDTSTGKCLRVIEEHEQEVFKVSFSEDGNKIVSSSDDKTLCIWDTASGKCLDKKHGLAEAHALSPGAWQPLQIGELETTVIADDRQALFFPDIIKEIIMTTDNVIVGGNKLGYVFMLSIEEF